MSSLPVSKPTCNAYFTPTSNPVCSNNCGAIQTPCSNQFAPHLPMPHSKSLEHYNETTKFVEHHNTSRHSFDQTISSNYDCIGVLQNTSNAFRHPQSTNPFPDHHYSPIVGVDRSSNMCCYQNPHYDYPNNFNARGPLKPRNVDYSNCNFQPQWV